MCTYNAISSHTDHFEIQKRDSEESLLTFVNLFPRNSWQFWSGSPGKSQRYQGSI